MSSGTSPSVSRTVSVEGPGHSVPTFDARSFPLALKLPARLYQVARWRKLLRAGKVHAELLEQLPAPLDIEVSARTLALAERYSRDAYHRLASRVIGDVQLHPMSLRTSHGNGGNAGTGWALDAGRLETLDERLVSIGQASLGGLLRAQRELHDSPIVVVPHRAWSEARLPDPGRETWQRVVLPVVRTLGPDVCVIGYNTAAGSGRPVPRSWDERALFDDRGRRI